MYNLCHLYLAFKVVYYRWIQRHRPWLVLLSSLVAESRLLVRVSISIGLVPYYPMEVSSLSSRQISNRSILESVQSFV